ncbi:MAG: SRPBCC family protein [Planctomycetota bacterium]
MIWIPVALIALVAILLLVGLALPEDFAYEVEREIAVPPAAVWAALHDPSSHPLGGRQCRGVSLLAEPGGSFAWREDLGASRVDYRVVESSEPRRLSFEAKDDVVPMSFRADLELEPTAAGTRVRVRVKGAIRRGTFHVPFFRLAIHLGAARKGLDDWLGRVGEDSQSAGAR